MCLTNVYQGTYMSPILQVSKCDLDQVSYPSPTALLQCTALSHSESHTQSVVQVTDSCLPTCSKARSPNEICWWCDPRHFLDLIMTKKAKNQRQHFTTIWDILVLCIIIKYPIQTEKSEVAHGVEPWTVRYPLPLGIRTGTRDGDLHHLPSLSSYNSTPLCLATGPIRFFLWIFVNFFLLPLGCSLMLYHWAIRPSQ